MSHAPIPVIAAVVRRDGLYLAGRRPQQKRHGGQWEFPGGKLLEGEAMLEAARRELAEELSLDAVSVGDTLFSADDDGAPFVIHFVEVVAHGDPVAQEPSAVGWFTLDELAAMSLAPADARLVEPALSQLPHRSVCADVGGLSPSVASAPGTAGSPAASRSRCNAGSSTRGPG